MNSLWIVGDLLTHHPDASRWTFLGVFSTEELARAACTEPSHFYAPATLDERGPDESAKWEGVVYPLAPSAG